MKTTQSLTNLSAFLLNFEQCNNGFQIVISFNNLSQKFTGFFMIRKLSLVYIVSTNLHTFTYFAYTIIMMHLLVCRNN